MKKLFAVLLSLVIVTALYAAPFPPPTDTRATPFNCTIVSTATALTAVTGCTELTSGQKRYITDVVWSSSIISTTTNFFQLTVGTGTDCATSARALLSDFSLAFTGKAIHFAIPLVSDANDGVCFVHPGAGTRNVTITGYIAP